MLNVTNKQMAVSSFLMAKMLNVFGLNQLAVINVEYKHRFNKNLNGVGGLNKENRANLPHS